MSENNTTAEICYNALNETIECVAESSSILDDIEVILLAIAALLGIAAWAKQKYAKMMEDGEITLDEVIKLAFFAIARIRKLFHDWTFLLLHFFIFLATFANT